MVDLEHLSLQEPTFIEYQIFGEYLKLQLYFFDRFLVCGFLKAFALFMAIGLKLA
jgi:hypothetical protein